MPNYLLIISCCFLWCIIQIALKVKLTMGHWTHHRNMSFNPDPSKQAQEAIFSRIINKESHPPLTFNNNIVYQHMSQKHLGIILGNRLLFEEHLTLVFTKINKTIGLLRKL